MRLRPLFPSMILFGLLGFARPIPFACADVQTLLSPQNAAQISSAQTPQSVPMRDFQLVVDRARLEVTRGVSYDPSYVHLSYPGGDVDPMRGVCTDVVIRALRAVGIDLQRLVHEDILKRPSAYKRGGKPADASIDHRRATPLLVYFQAHAKNLPIHVDTDEARKSYAPGDIIIWSLHRNGHPEHVGVVSDRIGPRGIPLVLHNIGPHPSEEDVLDGWQILGHFRAIPPAPNTGTDSPSGKTARR